MWESEGGVNSVGKGPQGKSSGKGWYKGKGFGKGFGKSAKGKGKGKSKGFQGRCYQCGAFGHSQSNCPMTQGKGGKSGGFQGSYHTCGAWGHTSRECGLKGKGRSKGKGVNAVESDEQRAHAASIETLDLGGSLGGVYCIHGEEEWTVVKGRKTRLYEGVKITDASSGHHSEWQPKRERVDGATLCGCNKQCGRQECDRQDCSH